MRVTFDEQRKTNHVQCNHIDKHLPIARDVNPALVGLLEQGHKPLRAQGERGHSCLIERSVITTSASAERL
jgi:hypothetical protein